MRIFSITAAYDGEAGDWYVADSDVPGLAIGAETLDALHERLQGAIADLVRLNDHQISPALGDDEEVDLQLIVRPVKSGRAAA